MSSINNCEKSLLKWIGGKKKILNHIINKIPVEMDNYHEIFLGGGTVLLALLSLKEEKKIIIKNKLYAYDINKELINVYKNIQDNKDELFKYIEFYKKEYSVINSLKGIQKPSTIEEAKTSKESYYYWLRNKYNTMESSVERSALFIILNKTCFRGIYREGPNGFNVPFGHYKKTPSIITKTRLDNISYLMKDVVFIHSDFKTSLKNIKENDFVYMDPPYYPIKKTSFVNYSKNGFNEENHEELFKICNEAKYKFLLSNSNSDVVLEKLKKFYIQHIEVKREINSKNPAMKAKEILIYN